MSERILAKIAEFDKLKAAYKAHKHTRNSRDIIAELRQEMKVFKKSLKKDWQEWMAIYDSIMNQPALS